MRHVQPNKDAASRNWRPTVQKTAISIVAGWAQRSQAGWYKPSEAALGPAGCRPAALLVQSAAGAGRLAHRRPSSSAVRRPLRPWCSDRARLPARLKPGPTQDNRRAGCFVTEPLVPSAGPSLTQPRLWGMAAPATAMPKDDTLQHARSVPHHYRERFLAYVPPSRVIDSFHVQRQALPPAACLKALFAGPW
jgi:hypothetical protein